MREWICVDQMEGRTGRNRARAAWFASLEERGTGKGIWHPPCRLGFFFVGFEVLNQWWDKGRQDPVESGICSPLNREQWTLMAVVSLVTPWMPSSSRRLVNFKLFRTDRALWTTDRRRALVEMSAWWWCGGECRGPSYNNRLNHRGNLVMSASLADQQRREVDRHA